MADDTRVTYYPTYPGRQPTGRRLPLHPDKVKNIAGAVGKKKAVDVTLTDGPTATKRAPLKKAAQVQKKAGLIEKIAQQIMAERRAKRAGVMALPKR